jgi:hypothetical protein
MPFGEPPVRFPAWDAPQERQLLERTSGRGAGGTGFKAPRGVPNGNGPDRTAWVGWGKPDVRDTASARHVRRPLFFASRFGNEIDGR